MFRPMATRLRCITVDITGTLMRYVGHIGDYYCLAAKRAGEPCPNYDRVLKGFKVGYEKTSKEYPCFGMHNGLANKDWWRIAVQRSFEEAGYFYSKQTGEDIFERIYAIFGSRAPYEVFDDVVPFLRWARAQGLRTGSLSNAAARYKDQIMPALGITEGSELDFQVYSGLVGIEKPDPRIFEMARMAAGSPDPRSMLHIGDSFRKDYQAAEGAGWHALLIDRFSGTPDAKMCAAKEGHMVKTLDEAKRWIQERGLLDATT